jgi:hypothetical protein
VGDGGDPGAVRLAELVAALSLGIDLGFGARDAEPATPG